MKRFVEILFPLLLLVACDMLGDGSDGGEGELRVSFDGLPSEETRAAMEMPDTNDFLLYVTDSKGKVIYEGAYGGAPESMLVETGTYNIKALSREFSSPEFSAPQYGDEQCVVVETGQTASVRLLCAQVNSGVRLRISSDFLTSYPDAALVLKSQEGSLMYSYSEKRIAYFLSGNISLVMTRSGVDNTLLTRWLGPGEILSLGVGASSSGASGPSAGAKEISISIDTSRVWIQEEFVIGEKDEGGKTPEAAISIAHAMATVGKKDVWIRGYVVGGDLTSASCSFQAPFTSATNIVLGPKSSTTNRASCLAVQLPTGSIRDELNLVSNPAIIGKKLCIKGDVVESYFGLVGVKNVTDFVFE